MCASPCSAWKLNCWLSDLVRLSVTQVTHVTSVTYDVLKSS